MKERIEKTVENICDWIDEKLESEPLHEGESTLPVMVSALAELVKARAELMHE